MLGCKAATGRNTFRYSFIYTRYELTPESPDIQSTELKILATTVIRTRVIWCKDEYATWSTMVTAFRRAKTYCVSRITHI